MVVSGKVQTEVMENSALPPTPHGSRRVVCISDTHDRLEDLGVPPGDILVHAGAT